MNLAWWCLIFVVVGFVVCNLKYGHIYGHRLKWRWMWIAHGALLWGMRLPDLERTKPRPRKN